MQLQAVLIALRNLEEGWAEGPVLADATSRVSNQIQSLTEFLQTSRGCSYSANAPRIYTGNRGRPIFDLDLDAAQDLHRLGNSWAQVAKARGVGRRTLLDHLERAGRSTSRPAYDYITDDELDELVAEISLSHPFVGGTIVLGHLESLVLHIPRHRVTLSLQRVDAIGVLTRYVFCPVTRTPYLSFLT